MFVFALPTFTFIINPVAGKGKGRKLIHPLEREITLRRLNAEIVLSERQGHAQELARASSADVIVAVGGDGTVNEVVNGMIDTEKTLGVIPNGSGNDLVKSLGIPADMRSALDVLVACYTRRIDAASVFCSGNSTARYFVNGVGIGFDAAVAERTTSMKYWSGFLLYLVAVLQTLGKYESPCFSIRLDGASMGGKKLLIAIGNGRCAGGGFYLTPDADVTDGVLDVCLIDDLSIPNILRVMPRVMKGAHRTFPGVQFVRTASIEVSASAPFVVHADGEIVGKSTTDVKVHILPAILNVIVHARFQSE
ncbi:MAG: diacylglycerol kinase [Ignavibacteria bacterium]